MVGGRNPAHSSTFSVTNNTAMDIILQSYGVEYFQVFGGPDWIHSTRFMVQAKSDSAVDDQLAKLNDNQARLEKQHMLQMLLAGRFQLKVHQETKMLPGFALVVTKHGLKLQEAKSVIPSPEEIKEFGGAKLPPLYQRGDGQRGYEFIAHGCSMKVLAAMLSGQFGTTVLDQTGLTGSYDFTLQYKGTIQDSRTDEPSSWPPLITGLQEQLGLKLESTKGPVETIVIDHIEKPSAN